MVTVVRGKRWVGRAEKRSASREARSAEMMEVRLLGGCGEREVVGMEEE